MRKVIDGKVYDTETAKKLVELPSVADRGSFDWHDTWLYQTRKGAFFIAGEGNARSRWARSVDNGSTSGRGLSLVTEEEARRIIERDGSTELFEAVFGASEEG